VRSLLSKRLKFRLIVTILALSLAGCGSESDRALEESFEHLYTVEPTANITVQNGDGAIFVYGSNTNEMRVRAIKRAYRRSRLTQIAIDVSTKPGSVSITTKFPPRPKWGLFDRSGTVDYTVVVPATASISGLDLNAGEILVDGMRGATTRARLGEGRVFARNCFTNLDLAIWRGNLILSYDWWEKSTFTAQANLAQGNAWAYLPVGGAFHLFAKAVHGEIFNDFETRAVAESAAARGVKVEALVNGGGEATIKFRVREGNITIVEARPQAK
jgi:hypothetical protein